MEEKTDVLFVIGSLGCGGAERIAVDILAHINKDNFHIDFLVPFGSDDFYKNRVESLGATIYYSPRFELLNRHSYRKWFKEFLNVHHYEIIHFHQVVMVASIADIIHAKGIKIISHAHSTSFRGNKFVVSLKKKLIARLPFVSEYMIGCSSEAGKNYFGTDGITSPKYTLLVNAIDTDRFAFSPELRDEIRNKYGILGEDFVLGHVGSLTQPKNHKFLVEVFSEIYKQSASYKLMLVGGGPLLEDIRTQAKLLGCLDGIVFVGAQTDVTPFYCAMDLFIFPSLHEGLPLSVVEAQANGLNCIISDAVTKDTAVCRNSAIYLRLDSIQEWVDCIEKNVKRPRILSNLDVIKSSSFDIRLYISKLEAIYEELMDGNTK